MVLVAEPTKPATAAATTRLTRYRAAKVAQAVRPIKMRGTMATRGSLKSGSVALKKLSRPKTRPVTMPTSGPSSTPPRIVGMCSMVAAPEELGIGINPMPGMTPKIIVIAARTPAVTMRPVVSDQVPVETSDVALLKEDLLCVAGRLSRIMNGYRDRFTNGLTKGGRPGECWVDLLGSACCRGHPMLVCPCGDRCGLQHLLGINLGIIGLFKV